MGDFNRLCTNRRVHKIVNDLGTDALIAFDVKEPLTTIEEPRFPLFGLSLW